MNSIFYVGTYTNDVGNNGIHIFNLNEETGEIQRIGCSPRISHPSYLAINKNKTHLYCVMEDADILSGEKAGIGAFEIDKTTGKLSFLNSVVSAEQGFCHLAVSPTLPYIVAANYRLGYTSLFSLQQDGRIERCLQMVSHIDKPGPNKIRQDKPHAHCAMFSSDNANEVFVTDLGLDTVVCYNIMNNNLIINNDRTFKVKPGKGPRHLLQKDNFIYVVNELTSDISVFQEESSCGKFIEIQNISMLPKNYNLESTASAIHFSKDGNFLYASNRGHDSIAIFKINNGLLQLLNIVHTKGQTPRDFAISPNNKFLVVAHQNSNSLVVFKILENGDIIDTKQEEMYVPRGVCVSFL